MTDRPSPLIMLSVSTTIYYITNSPEWNRDGDLVDSYYYSHVEKRIYEFKKKKNILHVYINKKNTFSPRTKRQYLI